MLEQWGRKVWVGGGALIQAKGRGRGGRIVEGDDREGAKSRV